MLLTSSVQIVSTVKINVRKHLRSLHKGKSIYLNALKGTSLLLKGMLVTCGFGRKQKYKYEKNTAPIFFIFIWILQYIVLKMFYQISMITKKNILNGNF